MSTKLTTLFQTTVGKSGSLSHKKIPTIRMTTGRTLRLVQATLLLSALAVVSVAAATEWTDHSGTICKNYNAGEVGYIDYFPNGTRTLRTTGTYLICPITRNTMGTYGAYIYVNLTHFGAQTTSCGAYSVNYDGLYIASTGSYCSGSGICPIGLSLYGYGNSNPYSNYSVLCYLPANGNGVLNTIDMYEY